MNDTTVRNICAIFDLGAPIGAPAVVPGGLTNRLWRIETTRGAFAVKEMNRDPDRADYVAWFDRAFSLERAAYHAGVPMPRPVPVTATGGCLAELAGSDGLTITVRVHEWIDGEKLENGTVYPANTGSRVAVILANIHALDATTGVVTNNALRVFGDEHWRSTADRAEQAGQAWARELRSLLPALRELEAYVTAAQADPTAAILSHRDADMKNFMRTAAGELMLVDWDAAGPVNPRYDLANGALVWSGVHLGDPDPALARAFVDAYRRASGTAQPFQPTDLAELVSVRLAWFEFNLRRALGEHTRDEAERQAGIGVLHRNVTQLPRFARSIETWLAILTE